MNNEITMTVLLQTFRGPSDENTVSITISIDTPNQIKPFESHNSGGVQADWSQYYVNFEFSDAVELGTSSLAQ